MVGLRSLRDLVPPYGHAVRDPDIISGIDHLVALGPFGNAEDLVECGQSLQRFLDAIPI
jgi:hypothetical protein